MSQESTVRPVVGIDLGTTNSAIAYIRGGKPELIAEAGGQVLLPSVVLIDPKGQIIVGQDAKDALVAMPDRSIAAVKRKMGNAEELTLAGQSYTPEEISAFILKELKLRADELYGDGEKEAVITVPAYFNDEQRRATKYAGELAGFVVERIINEPTAAALSFGLDHLQEDRTFLVYDLGGGTFDVSIVEMFSGVLEVKASTGDRMLGGEDFDWRLVDWFSEQIVAEHGVDPRLDIRGKALLKEEAERVKIALSTEETVTVALPLVTIKDNHPVGLAVEVTRVQFNTLIKDLIEKTMERVSDVIREAELTAKDVNEVLLVGGSTRIPMVRDAITVLLGRAPRSDVHPDEAVALGAAVQAGLKSGLLSESGLIATDVAPFSMGIAVLAESAGGRERPGAFAPIISRNTVIPVTRSQKFYTSAPGQTKVGIEIYQGEHEWVKYNHRLGEFMLEGIPEDWRGQEAVEVTFRYNLNGILEVAARSVSSGEEMTITVQDALNRNNRREFEESVQRLQQVWENAARADDEQDQEENYADNVYAGLEDWDLLPGFPEDLDEIEGEWDIPEEDEEPTMLHEAGKRLVQQAREVLAGLETSRQPELLGMILELEQALQEEDVDKLQQAMDQVTDQLIEAEL
ncbi:MULTISPECIES: Hsp70 family protein [unclassified Paenibacillus]|uniref:Hsp70 family protein n=1 Tax=unclassified Paenibacillus TaxID=185978 RepID=UPI002405FC6C|nr:MULTISPECIES: Hsp70 family protein [unclassified Paenibacillus]MDF9842487.1 molecular chaperone DnaK [Paenibacillus sp. PastF-2]MDF9849077.1 molecular chaperone DnaK [Paenibacillus sp. PastM-2]MDF9855647.1 molecular chaperone DnaK [Paenibacillus sp. PastF-1]MDH6480919.1 molecular chaperone DnaK [Paenibacillus sp. PastH-2]MDH6508341.1 molecular chaperone DnaK [Paenibacillus sp. PastM-3]